MRGTTVLAGHDGERPVGATVDRDEDRGGLQEGFAADLGAGGPPAHAVVSFGLEVGEEETGKGMKGRDLSRSVVLVAVFDDQFEIPVDHFVIQPVGCAVAVGVQGNHASKIAGGVITVPFSEGGLNLFLPFGVEFDEVVVCLFRDKVFTTADSPCLSGGLLGGMEDGFRSRRVIFIFL